MSTRRSPAAPDSKPTQLLCAPGRVTAAVSFPVRSPKSLGLGTVSRIANSKFRILNPDRRRTPLCVSKQKELAISGEYLEKLYLIEKNKVISFESNGLRKNAGGKYEGKSHYVIEKKYRRNVRNRPRHYMHENNAHRGRTPLYL